MSSGTNRRMFLKTSSAVGVGYWVSGIPASGQTKSPNEKLNIATVGAGGQAGSDIRSCRSENFVALCDIDDKRAAGSFNKYPKAKKFRDFRKMLDSMEKEIDAVIVACPDHTHAIASVWAMRMGKHVYCEKPLTWSVHEARVMAETAKKYKVQTQMGNHGTANSGLRQAVEVIQSGAIGPVREIHVWTNRPIWPQGTEALLKHSGVQAGLHGGEAKSTPPPTQDWDLWLSVAQPRPYDDVYLPFKWRGWRDFGTGALGDMACHTANMPFMACKLGAPSSVDASASGFNKESYPTWSVITYEFPAREGLPPCKYYWYDGGDRKPQWAIDRLDKAIQGQKLSASGCALVGDKGTLFSPNDYGAKYSLLPEKDFEGYEPPPRRLPRTRSHHYEWIQACKGGPPAMSNFSYSGPLTEMVLLGNVAAAAGKKIEWDSKNLRVTNDERANSFIRREYRKGWDLISETA